MTDVFVEDEVKVELPPGVALPPLADAKRGYVADAARPVRLTSAYWDCADHRLLAAGVSVRRRTKGRTVSWDVKTPVKRGATARREITFADRSAEPPASVTDLLLAWTGGDPLVPVATLKARRLTWTIRTADGTEVAEVVDDEVDGGNGVRFREVEVERRGVAEAYVTAVTKRLRAAGGTPSETNKVGRVVGVPATTRPVPKPSGPVSALLVAGLANATTDLLLADVGARLAEDDAVHQMRVACRRMRSLLRAFGKVLDPVWKDALTDELRWVGAALAAARDAEVIEARLRKSAADLDATPLLDAVEAKRLAAEDDVRTLQCDERYLALLRRLRTEAPPIVADVTPAKTYAADVVASAERAVDRAVRTARRSRADDDWHAVRIAAKKLRYTAEASAPVGSFGKVAKRAERTQDVLGEFHDTVQATALLESLADVQPYVVGRLVEREQQAGEAYRARFGEVWR